ncbi:hypothetical protein T4E_7005 [Trichinella pseudospiralis]|uniref:Uncharacterized protein n=1 Tax=Trichinella pseudospiralis TaxID=6337 RepID=A0A0V0YQ91_TRIPS|nr:hypothetical protein T4E_7005 [Trichinella pseudospiralis]
MHVTTVPSATSSSVVAFAVLTRCRFPCLIAYYNVISWRIATCVTVGKSKHPQATIGVPRLPMVYN